MENKLMYWTRLPLENAYNARELGGIPTSNGGQTAWRKFIRTDDISKLTDKDIAFLLDYGVKTVIDLRSLSEAKTNPDRLNETYGVKNINISFMENIDLSPEAQAEMAKNFTLSDMYVELLKRKETVCEIFRTICNAEDGCILFHCSAGKDRTGVLAMLLLVIAGADKQDCVNNYAQTYINLTRDDKLFAYLQNISPDMIRLIESRPEYIEKAYNYVVNYDGGIEEYLLDCGLTANEITAVKKRVQA